MARFLAVLAAVGMVVGAFVYRYGVPGSGSDGDGGGGGNAAGGKLVCAAELGDAVCDALGGADDVVVEPAGDTADRLIKVRSVAEADVAGWLAPGPWPAMVDDARALASKPALFAKTGTGLAAAPLVAVIRKPSGLTACTADVTWKCIGDAAQATSFRVGADGPATSTGLFIRAAAVNGFFGNADWATNDLQDNPDAQTWVANLNDRLRSASGFGAGSLESFRLQRGSAAVYLSGGAAANSQAGNVDFEVRIPTPAVTIAVTFTPAARGGRDVDTGPLLDPLRSAGWKVQSATKTEGLPSPGVLLALRSS